MPSTFVTLASLANRFLPAPSGAQGDRARLGRDSTSCMEGVQADGLSDRGERRNNELPRPKSPRRTPLPDLRCQPTDKHLPAICTARIQWTFFLAARRIARAVAFLGTPHAEAHAECARTSGGTRGGRRGVPRTREHVVLSIRERRVGTRCRAPAARRASSGKRSRRRRAIPRQAPLERARRHRERAGHRTDSDLACGQAGLDITRRTWSSTTTVSGIRAATSIACRSSTNCGARCRPSAIGPWVFVGCEPVPAFHLDARARYVLQSASVSGGERSDRSHLESACRLGAQVVDGQRGRYWTAKSFGDG